MSGISYTFLGNSRSRGFADVPIATVVLYDGLREASGGHYDEHSRELLRSIADALRGKSGVGISIVRDGARQNPASSETLVHHGRASEAWWHVLEFGSNNAIADLYGAVAKPEVAQKVARAIANAMGKRVALLYNAPGKLMDHPVHGYYGEARQNPHRGPRPVAGQSWRGIMDGALDRVVSVSGSRVQVLHTESGNREWVDLGEFVATHKPATGTRKNPKRGKVYPCKAHGGAHDYTVCPKCRHQYCPQSWAGCPRCSERAARKNPSRDVHRAAPAVGSYWTRLSYPQHIARVVAVRRAAGGAPPMVRLDIVTGRGQVMGTTELPLEDVLQGYEPMSASSPYRKTLPNPRIVHAKLLGELVHALESFGLPGTGDYSREQLAAWAAKARKAAEAKRNGPQEAGALRMIAAHFNALATDKYGPGAGHYRDHLAGVARALIGSAPSSAGATANPGSARAGFLEAIDRELVRRGMPPATAAEADQLEAEGWGQGRKTVAGNAAGALMMTRGHGFGQAPHLYRNPGRQMTEAQALKRARALYGPSGWVRRGYGPVYEVGYLTHLGSAFEITAESPVSFDDALDKAEADPNAPNPCVCEEVRTLPGPGVWSVDDGWAGFHSPNKCWLPHESTMGLVGGLGTLIRRTSTGEIKESNYSRRPKWTRQDLGGNIERDGGDGGPFGKPESNPGHSRACACAAITPPNKLVWTLEGGYEGVHSWGRCWAPNMTDRGGLEVKAGGARKSTRGVPGWVQSALDERREFGEYGGAHQNPTVRISGTIKMDRVGRRRSRRPASPRRPALAIVPRARAKRGRTEHARRPLEAGEGVTVPYTGRSSYFGRPVKRTSEPATVLGYTDSSTGGRLVQVQVRRGKGAEVHAFPEHQVRRRPSRALRYKSESEKHPEIRQRLEAAIAGDQGKALHLLELADDELQAAHQTAEALRPQADEKSSPDYLAARRTEKKALARTQALNGILGRIQQAAPGYVDPWAIANGRRRPRGTRARAEKTFRMWHEFGSSKATKVHGPDRVIPGTLVKLGDLVSVTYRSDKYAGGPDNPSGKPLLYEHKTKRPHPVLATDPEGKSVHIVGGRMTVTGDGLVN